MPTLNVELTLDDLLTVVSNLDEDEFTEFEIRFEQVWLSRVARLDQEAAQIATTQRLPAHQQARLRSLLEKNREALLTEPEETELDDYIVKIDQPLGQTATELLKSAEKHQQHSPDKNI